MTIPYLVPHPFFLLDFFPVAWNAQIPLFLVKNLFSLNSISSFIHENFTHNSRPGWFQSVLNFFSTWLPKWLSGKTIWLPIQKTQSMQFRSLGQEDPLEEDMATHSSVLAWEIPWTEEPGGLYPMGSQRVGHSWACMRLSLYLRNGEYIIYVYRLILPPHLGCNPLDLQDDIHFFQKYFLPFLTRCCGFPKCSADN